MSDRIRMMIVARVLMASIGLVSSPLATSQIATSQSPASAPPLRNPEFPTFDDRVWTLQRTGLLAKAATQRLGQSPDDPETVEILIQARRIDDALRAARIVVDTRPSQMARVFEILAQNRFPVLEDESKGYGTRLKALVDAARTKLASLSKEDAAAAARFMVSVEMQAAGRAAMAGTAREDRLRAFIEEYAGTDAALMGELDLLARERIPQRLEALEAFVRAHPRTIAGARALHQRGFDLAHNVGNGPTASDPTDRFLQVVAIVKELESGAYPPCQWVQRAPDLVIEFFAMRPTYSPENLDRTIEASRAFVLGHLPAELPSIGYGLSYFITSRMADLYQRKGDAMAGVEGLLAEIEKASANADSVRYLRAQFYMRDPEGRSALVTSNPEMRQKAKETLTALHAQGGDGLYQRKALATLAWLSLQAGDYRAARDQFKKYAAAYPQSDYAWVAALRVGLAEEAAEDWNAALASYRSVAERYAPVRVARVLAHAYAARAAEALGRFDQALIDYTAARGAWDVDYGDAYSLYTIRVRTPNQPMPFVDDARVEQAALWPRIEQLTWSTRLPGGDLLERGRWLLEKGRQQEAIAVLAELRTRHPQSEASAEGGMLMSRARIERALNLADAESSTRDEAAAIAALDDIARSPTYDFGVCAAKIAKASLLSLRGSSAEAETLMSAALNEWVTRRPSRVAPASSSAPSSSSSSSIEADVAEIRAQVFRPKGDGIYAQGQQWGTFRRAAASLPPPFVLVNPDLSVKLSNGDTMRVSLSTAPISADVSTTKTLWLDRAELATLERVIVTLGGTKLRQPTSVMQPMNQPMGGSMTILAFWSKFFAARPAPWVGWLFETPPTIDQIEFTNAERTTANARVTIDHEGGTVVLEKDHGRWIAKKIVNRWIT